MSMFSLSLTGYRDVSTIAQISSKGNADSPMRFIKSYFQPPLASKETGNIDDTYWDDDFPDDTRIRDSDLAVLAVLIYVGGIGLLIILSIGIAIDFLFIGTPAIRILGILLLISFSIYKVYTLLRPPK